jgi:hypothetical protein
VGPGDICPAAGVGGVAVLSAGTTIFVLFRATSLPVEVAAGFLVVGLMLFGLLLAAVVDFSVVVAGCVSCGCPAGCDVASGSGVGVGSGAVIGGGCWGATTSTGFFCEQPEISNSNSTTTMADFRRSSFMLD